MLSVGWVLELLIVSQIAAHDVNNVGRALQEPVNALWEHGFVVTNIFLEPAKAFVSARVNFPGTRVDIGVLGAMFRKPIPGIETLCKNLNQPILCLLRISPSS